MPNINNFSYLPLLMPTISLQPSLHPHNHGRVLKVHKKVADVAEPVCSDMPTAMADPVKDISTINNASYGSASSVGVARLTLNPSIFIRP